MAASTFSNLFAFDPAFTAHRRSFLVLSTRLYEHFCFLEERQLESPASLLLHYYLGAGFFAYDDTHLHSLSSALKRIGLLYDTHTIRFSIVLGIGSSPDGSAAAL